MQHRIRVKFCGITQYEDAVRAVDLGVDALGFVFYPDSPRYIAPSAAAAIMAGLPPFVCKVGLFVNPRPAELTDVLRVAPVDVVQFHGDETPALCGAAPKPYIKAIRMNAQADIAEAAQSHAGAAALLLDSYEPDAYGGTGVVFDWTRIPDEQRLPLILAGGLNAKNVAAAIRVARPYAVDVSSGIEYEKGRKDHRKMLEFIEEVRSVEREYESE